MNNYSSPSIIRTVNRVELIIGIILAYLTTYVLLVEKLNAYSKIMQFTALMFVVYWFVCAMKLYAYLACIFEGYRVSVIGMILYIIWMVLGLILGGYIMTIVLRANMYV